MPCSGSPTIVARSTDASTDHPWICRRLSPVPDSTATLPFHVHGASVIARTGLIDTQSALERLVEHLRGEIALAVDCEMDAMYAYRTSLCLVQIGWPEGEVLLDAMVDLDWSPLDELFADKHVMKVFHGGENDVGLMASQWDLSFRNLFDTMAAAQVLGHERVGLAPLLADQLDVKVSKEYQKADWRVRPLPAEQADYARLDVRHLLELRDVLLSDLEELGRVEEAQSEFHRITQARAEVKPFEPDGWARVRGAKELDKKRWSVLRAVFIARDEIARRRDRAPYRVSHESALIEMARRQPANLADIKRLRGLNRHLSTQDQEHFLAAVRAGREADETTWPTTSRRSWQDGAGGLAPDQQTTFDALRAWRAVRAKKRGVAVARIATNALLTTIVRADPKSLDELGAVDGVENWRLREYGEDLLEVLRKASEKASS